MKTYITRLLWALALLAVLSATNPASAHYDPGTQRWINRDPLGDEVIVQQASRGHPSMYLDLLHFEGHGNLYRFNYNNPSGYVDKDGRQIAIPVGGGIVIGGVAIAVATCNAIPSCHRWLVAQVMKAVEACKAKPLPPQPKWCPYMCPVSGLQWIPEPVPGGGCPASILYHRPGSDIGFEETCPYAGGK